MSKVFKQKISSSKIGTPSYFHSIINQKKTKNIFKEKIFDGKLSKFFDPIKTWKYAANSLKKKKYHIFLWRIFIQVKF